MKKFSFTRFCLSLALVAGFVACSSDSNTTKVLDNPEGSENSNPEDPDNSNQSERLAALISGSVEAETFLEGAKVKLFELNGSMEQSGRSVTGSIDAAGNYTVAADSFSSPYAEIVVSGMAKLPCSGMGEDTKISTIVDITKDSSVNLNLFTSFASAKAKKLVNDDKMEFSKAWEQAENDVRKWFALPQDGPSIKTLRINGEGRSLELHELSLLHERMSRAYSNMNFSIFRETTAGLFAELDELNNNSIFFSLGFAAYTFDMDMSYNQWCTPSAMLTSDDADYRAYAHLLWLSLMGEKECTAELKDTIHEVDPPLGGFIATYDSPHFYTCDGNAWHLSKIEAMPIKYPEPEDGFLVTDQSGYVFDKETGWRYATRIEIVIKRACVKSREGTIEDKYFCTDTGWIEIPRLDQLFGSYCNAKTRGDTVHVGYSSFVCKDAWEFVSADSLDEWVEDPRDGKSYLIVPMGSQRWMGGNLRYRDSVKTPNLAGNIWCFTNLEVYCTNEYGALYSWTAAMDLPDDVDVDTVKLTLPHRGICPEGWHVPSKADWDTLFAFVAKFGPQDKLALALMGKRGWAGGAYTPTLNTFGFNAAPGGRRSVDGTYEGEYRNAYYWYTAETFKRLPYYYMTYATPDISEGTFGDTDWAASVRCVEDAK